MNIKAEISYNNNIEVRNVRKYFKDVKAVDDITLKIGKGSFVALLGPNGAGKTTLVEMVEGIQRPDSGEIIIRGMTWNKNTTELHRLVGISFQETKFIDKLTVLETFELFASFYNLGSSRIEEVLELINLGEKRDSYVVNLSGGQRQRLAVGLAILSKPGILLLDEPTTGLDPAAKREIWDILLNLKKDKNTSLILTTHYMEEAEFLCDYIIIMDKGKILDQGTLEELLNKSPQKELAELIFQDELSAEKICSITDSRFRITRDAKKGMAKFSYKNGKITDHLPEFIELINKNDIKIKTLSFRKITLEDIFLSMTGRHLNE